MVNNKDPLDRVFAALGSAKRRAILALLDNGDGVSISELAQPLAMKLPLMLKHLAVLEDARLIERVKGGRTTYVRLVPDVMQEALQWLQRYERFWSSSLDRLVLHAEAQQREGARP